ncbi:hypothetical protein CDEST_01435 [Colletotrichum destructivum]|uniref:Uncharacterized protein n=1 Tax=Colletotrichum destructivum TaxID=34406 RepID=A0AAX4I020_9PEZI|nr:hypothetical protein CDEST_01435 [Colletotrichum destructivum]
METKSTPQMETSSNHGPTAMSSLGPETASPPAPAVSPRNANDNSKMLLTQFEQYGSLTSEPAIQWPKLKKVAPKTMLEVNKEPLPWMQKQLRRVQKEENISQQVRDQKSADVELWRSQLRKISALDVGSLDHDEDVDHGDHKRAGTCLTCPRETPSSSPLLDDLATHTPDIPTRLSGAEREGQDDQLHNSEQKRLKEIGASSSQRSSSRISTMTKVESTTVTHVYQVNEPVYSTSESLTAKENIVGSAEQAGKELSRSHTSAIEVFSPMPIMPPNHTCSWKDRYLNLTAEVRQLKAEILSQERRKSSELVDVGVDVGQGEDYGLGVEGLTIVMHLKGKDDLIINTDLTQASSDV